MVSIFPKNERNALSLLFRLALAILSWASSTHSKKVPMHVTKTVLCNQGRRKQRWGGNCPQWQILSRYHEASAKIWFKIHNTSASYLFSLSTVQTKKCSWKKFVGQTGDNLMNSLHILLCLGTQDNTFYRKWDRSIVSSIIQNLTTDSLVLQD